MNELRPVFVISFPIDSDAQQCLRTTTLEIPATQMSLSIETQAKLREMAPGPSFRVLQTFTQPLLRSISSSFLEEQEGYTLMNNSNKKAIALLDFTFQLK